MMVRVLFFNKKRLTVMQITLEGKGLESLSLDIIVNIERLVIVVVVVLVK
jgi:hypothetical protein